MSGVYLTRTNQKLNFTRIHLDALKVAQESTGWSKHALIESYNESVLFHMASAYSSLLREIAEQYSFDANRITKLSQLVAQMEAQGLEAPEVAELQQLHSNADSWLHKLLAAYKACWRAEEHKESRGQAESVSEIHVMQINPDHAEDSDILSEYQLWFSEFKSLVERMRSSMQEW
ncbi:hypothetical protein Q4508_04250 [Amphritea sp. 2_MG-2023]|jgi:hypothetical protein|uniref:DUF6586 family protein n=1 Tax=Amphritea TaxID=515417 RepID=UPI001C06E29A|nr:MULTISPECIES: DUF6586 family protein [Amphritea]MBU2964433.1 hypothetical protein [Amphritea atlantica]MDO6417761.1 hypothetical protein [Amphritea sp. 2_MG-2023]MDX2424309.1 hypothetical protein [Amphritea sp.]